MQEYGLKNSNANLADAGLNVAIAHWNLSSEELTKKTIELGQGELNDTNALCVSTGKFTGRSPKDKFTVKDAITEKSVDWGDVNIPFAPEAFDKLYDKVCAYLSGKEVWVRDAYACADPKFRLNIRVVNETPWANLFCNDLFLRPTEDEIKTQTPDWTIIQAPGFQADPAVDGTRQGNFTIVNFTRKVILIGGSAYTGEMKKGIFGVLNFVLPHDHKVLSMHCSANEGKDGDVALFFGLSGTGKTTLSADPNRALIGDDEHGWADGSVFNFEGGCYAKCIDLSAEKEPQIFNAIKPGALLENIKFIEGTKTVDYADGSITENTRAAYPIFHIDNAKEPSYGGDPKNIFFLTCDAFGILPPISKLTKGQAMYHFISGYTAKVAGTEVGVTEPQTTFSACFGRVFLPLHPTKYAELLGKKLEEHPDAKVWLINTGWSGGAYGTGSRMSLKYTRAMITAALNGELDNVEYVPHSVFGVLKPQSCPGVPAEILNPRETWADKEAYDKKANELAGLFVKNFEKYADQANEEILAAAPKVAVDVIN
ncbi:phosphoenolpyruvate carboxykinase (ATP) [Taibaiella chishuiensis]|uniref:Phosphoenolpyruvate carboxykinase (ATP) n=1 Tax=Taibaiella chishuiensis TaxID=1434707 RepID=A0A2P8CYX0_9BACT|nr:phosphoenolpyruvate carboxykinase (ATP) [Taibaiella chishuiensis]PSK90126.1 phosphoenolpyruvate carboxykinase (ATP) [Taibaiella chishuiensis]